MSEQTGPFVHMQNLLSTDDIDFLKTACRQYVAEKEIPCYVLMDQLGAPTFHRIQAALEAETRQELHYLNDFYMYTDESFAAGWHMDTELYTFENALNAWILLSPEEVDSPLAIIDGINEDPDESYHFVKTDGDDYLFGNLCTGSEQRRPLATVEADRIHAPNVRIGDVLAFAPKRFHKTAVSAPKHCLVIKFVFGSRKGCLSETPVPDLLWPEAGLFREIIDNSEDWEDVVDGVRAALGTSRGRELLSAGFYPEKFGLYGEMAEHL